MNYYKITYVALMILTLCVYSSCSESSITDEDLLPSENVFVETSDISYDIENAPFEEQVAYTEEHLKIVAKYILKAADQPEFYTSVLNNVKGRENRFDNDIMVKDALNEGVMNSMSLSPPKSQELSNSLEAFKNIDDVDYAPKIYIPFFEQKIKTIANQKSDENRLIVVISVTEDEGIESLMGYYEEEGELIESGILVDEDYAANNPVFVLGLGDSDCNGNYYSSNCDQDQSEDTSEDDFPVNNDVLFIERMKVKQHKEDWHNGRSEIHYVRILINKTSGEVLTSQSSDTGNKLRDFRRSWIRDNERKNINKTINSNLLSGVDHLMVVFEKDGFPAPVRSKSVMSTNGQLYTLYYKSFQDEYDARSFDQGTQNLNRDNVTNSIDYSTLVL